MPRLCLELSGPPTQCGLIHTVNTVWAARVGRPSPAYFHSFTKMSKVAAHRKNTKAGIDIDEARRKREDNIIELRKNKRDENLQKKRQTFVTPQYASEDSTKGPGTQRVR